MLVIEVEVEEEEEEHLQYWMTVHEMKGQTCLLVAPKLSFSRWNGR